MVSGSKSNDRPTGLPSDLTIVVRTEFRPIFSVLPKGREWRVILIALLAALLLHILTIVATLFEWPEFFARKLPPPEIPVELVFEEPPKADVRKDDKPPPIIERESGGDPSLAQGRVAQPAEQAAAPTPAPPKPEAAPSIPDVPETDELADIPPPLHKPAPPAPLAPTPPKQVETPPAPRQATPPAPTTQAPPKPPTRLTMIGQGGGDAYLNQIQAMIERQRSYPEIGNPMRLEGIGVYEIRITRDGKIVNVYLRRSTGVGTLDEEGRKIIYRSGPYPPVPLDIPGNIVQLILDLPITP